MERLLSPLKTEKKNHKIWKHVLKTLLWMNMNIKNLNYTCHLNKKEIELTELAPDKNMNIIWKKQTSWHKSILFQPYKKIKRTSVAKAEHSG